MSRNAVLLILFGILCISLKPKPVLAWTPCFPFCDAGCSGAASMLMGTTLSGTIIAMQSSCLQLTSELAKVNTEFAQLAAAFSREMVYTNMSLLSGLDAGVNKLGITSDKRSAVLEATVDNFNMSFVTTLKGISAVSSISVNNANLGPSTQPELIITNTASDIILMMAADKRRVNEYRIILDAANKEAMDSKLRINMATKSLAGAHDLLLGGGSYDESEAKLRTKNVGFLASTSSPLHQTVVKEVLAATFSSNVLSTSVSLDKTVNTTIHGITPEVVMANTENNQLTSVSSSTETGVLLSAGLARKSVYQSQSELIKLSTLLKLRQSRNRLLAARLIDEYLAH